MITFVTTRADKWYQGQIKPIRDLRGKDSRTQMQGIQRLIDKGLIPAEQVSSYLEVFKYGWAPDFVFDGDYIDGLPRAKDLIVGLPFVLADNTRNRRGDSATRIGDAWFQVAPDTAPIGSISMDEMYEVFSCNASESMNPTYYSDPSLDWGERGVNCWVRVK